MLDLLITRYLYQRYTDIDPGELTDLRSASVNNESFAQVAVRQNLQLHLQHCSTLLSSQISEYVSSFFEPHNTTRSLQGTKGPKVSSFFYYCYYFKMDRCFMVMSLHGTCLCFGLWDCFVILASKMSFFFFFNICILELQPLLLIIFL